MKNRLRSPAFVRARSRLFARVVEWNPATTFACSRSMILKRDSSRNNLRSRSCTSTFPFLFPLLEACVISDELSLSLADLSFHIAPAMSPSRASTIIEICVPGPGLVEARHAYVLPRLRSTLHDHVAFLQVLQEFRERASASERPPDLLGIERCESKEHVSANP